MEIDYPIIQKGKRHSQLGKIGYVPDAMATIPVDSTHVERKIAMAKQPNVRCRQTAGNAEGEIDFTGSVARMSGQETTTATQTCQQTQPEQTLQVRPLPRIQQIWPSQLPSIEP